MEWVNKLPIRKRAIGNHIFFKEKLNGYSQRARFKTCITTKSFVQVPREDFMKTFSSAANFTILQVFLSLAIYEIHQVNIVTVYFQYDHNEEIYMEVSDSIQKLGLDSYF